MSIEFEFTAKHWQNCIDKMPLIAILRGVSHHEVRGVAECVIAAGFTALEVPLNSPEPFKSIELLAREFGDTAVIGAGTVLSAQDASRAIDAGSAVVIAPNLNPAVARVTLDGNAVYCPGVATPTEAFTAIEYGAVALKLFPAELISPAVVKAMKAVLPNTTDLFAVGGIEPNNMQAYLDAGVKGFGIGSALYKSGKSLADVEMSARLFTAAL